MGSTARINVTCVNDDSCGLTLDNPERLLEFWETIIAEQPDYEPEKESFCVIMLNVRLRAYAWHRVSVGIVNECHVHPREVFRPVIASGAYAFAMMHNHPSGDPRPSRADKDTTRLFVEAANLLQIRLIDHVVVGLPAPDRLSYYSFQAAGLIP